MGTNLPDLLGGHRQGLTAVYLVDYLKWLNRWPAHPKFDRERFRYWLAHHTHADGAYGLDYVLDGLHELLRGGYIKDDGTGTEMLTPEFVTIMNAYQQ